MNRSQIPTGTDGELLAVFSQTGNQDAFAELVRRHGPMVQAVGQRVLNDHHAAQDVTQAAFVVLARKAKALSKDPSVSGWLYTVARRLALTARQSGQSRQQREQQAMSQDPQPPSPAVDAVLFRSELDEALGQLPERYRRPLVLFHLQSKSLDETGRLLGLNPNTLRTRLGRARELLRKKLVARGITIGSVGALTVLLSAESGAAVLPSTFVASTVGAATGTAAVSASVSALSQGALKAMFIAKVKTVTLTAAACLIVAGTGVVAAKQLSSAGTEPSIANKPTDSIAVAQNQPPRTGPTLPVPQQVTSPSNGGATPPTANQRKIAVQVVDAAPTAKEIENASVVLVGRISKVVDGPTGASEPPYWNFLLQFAAEEVLIGEFDPETAYFFKGLKAAEKPVVEFDADQRYLVVLTGFPRDGSPVVMPEYRHKQEDEHFMVPGPTVGQIHVASASNIAAARQCIQAMLARRNLTPKDAFGREAAEQVAARYLLQHGYSDKLDPAWASACTIRAFKDKPRAWEFRWFKDGRGAPDYVLKVYANNEIEFIDIAAASKPRR